MCQKPLCAQAHKRQASSKQQLACWSGLTLLRNSLSTELQQLLSVASPEVEQNECVQTMFSLRR